MVELTKDNFAQKKKVDETANTQTKQPNVAETVTILDEFKGNNIGEENI